MSLALAAGCQGADEFYRFNDASQMGSAGATPAGAAGTMGNGGSNGGAAGGPMGLAGNGGSTGSGGTTGTAGTGPGTAGTTGSGGGGGSIGPGGRGGTTVTGGTTGTAGRGGTTGTAGTSGTAGTVGTAGAGGGAGGSTAGRGGTTGTGGTTGAAGRGGTTGAGGGAGTTGTGGTTGTAGRGGTGGSAASRVEVQAQCQANNDAQNIRVTFRVLNPESVAKQYSDIKVRYYFTPTAQLAPMVTFDYSQKIPSGMLTATATATYVEIGFDAGAGTLAAFDTITGSDQIQLRIYNYSTPTWNGDVTDDWSNVACAGGPSSTFVDRPKMPGYYQGQLAWGSEP